MRLRVWPQADAAASEIGFLFGLEDPNSFFRAFHDRTGTTPDAVRKSLH